jgi:hypothetical protein
MMMVPVVLPKSEEAAAFAGKNGSFQWISTSNLHTAGRLSQAMPQLQAAPTQLFVV